MAIPEWTVRDWIVTETGDCQLRPSARQWDLLREQYYLHQFLTEIMELLDQALTEADQWDFLPQIRRKVRQLFTNSYWLQTRYEPPKPQTGVAVTILYDEIGYPLTVENVSSLPGVSSPVHNHGTWGVVALLQGSEKHYFWRRSPTPAYPDHIELVGEKTLHPGEIISFTPEAIHSIQSLGSELTVTFNLYGDSQPRSRFQFDPEAHTAKPF